MVCARIFRPCPLSVFTYDASAQGLELTVGALGYVGALAELYSRIENLAHEFYEPPFEIVFVCRILVHALDRKSVV